jgi:DNA-binding NtrC family response regulator
LAAVWNRLDLYDHLVVVADEERRRCDLIRQRLEAVPGRDRVAAGAPAAAIDRYPRFRVVLAHDGEQAITLTSRDVSAVMVNLLLPRCSGLEVIGALRRQRADLAILSFAPPPAPDEAASALPAGADHFLELADEAGIHHALDVAIDRRRLALLIDRNAEQVEEARQRLARLASESTVPLPGLRPPAAASAVLPFHEAAHRYLLACAKIFEGDPRGLAQRLGISYFALRRLLKRYDVPFPGRTRRQTARRR